MRYFVTGKQAAEIDRYTIEEIGIPQLVLMERAALAAAEEVAKVVADIRHDRILIVAESGNNGGDGVAAARILHQRGYLVDVWTLNGISRKTEAYIKQVELAEKAGVHFIYYMDSLKPEADGTSSYRVIVDAIFGVGLTREVGGIQREAVTKINAAKEESGELAVVALDIPTGISSETGDILGAAVRADKTVTFGFEKVGMRFAKEFCGNVTVAEIGFYLPEKYKNNEETLFYGYEPSDVARLLPMRRTDGNKGSFGHVLVVAGSKDMSGAAYLAAEAAYRTGCGLVKVVTHESNRPAMQQMLPEAILLTYEYTCQTEKKGVSSDNLDDDLFRKIDESIRWASVIIVGPGLGQSDMALKLSEYILRHATCPVVADADAINMLSEHTEILAETAGSRPLILTPHMLEMARLAEKTQRPDREAVNRIKKDRLSATGKPAEEYGATIVLKDACTLVAEGETAGYLNTSGNDAMAKGGSGDVLTGVIAGLIAEGMKAEAAARLGVYIHGLAGDAAREKLGAYSVIARDLLDHISLVMNLR